MEINADSLSFLLLDCKLGKKRMCFDLNSIITSPNFEILVIKITLELCRFYFDFSMTYVGAGMICSHLVNLSLLLGAVVSYGIMWPLIKELKGEWYPASLSESSMKSLNGYKVWF